MDNKAIIEKHPCFSESAHTCFARVHLAVAPMCNIACRFCIRSLNKSENRPGVATRILASKDAVTVVERAMEKFPVSVVGIAGPGDPLFNPATFETFELIDKKFPALLKCLSTNGLLLKDRLEELKRINLSTLTVTVNAMTAKTAARIYDFISVDGKTYRGEKAGAIMVDRQKEGITAALGYGIPVKINTVFVPKINAKEIPAIAKHYGRRGANIMNIMPLIPINKMAGYRPPNDLELEEMRSRCEQYLPQFRSCKQCRADAVGIPAFEKKCAPGATNSTDYFHF